VIQSKRLQHKYEKKYNKVIDEREFLVKKVKEYEPKFKSPFKKRKAKRRYTVNPKQLGDLNKLTSFS